MKKQKVKCETLSYGKMSEQKCWHVESLRTLELLDDVVALLRNLGWLHYVGITCMSYDRLILSF